MSFTSRQLAILFDALEIFEEHTIDFGIKMADSIEEETENKSLLEEIQELSKLIDEQIRSGIPKKIFHNP